MNQNISSRSSYKISELAYSPVEMMMHSEPLEKIEAKNDIYYFNFQKTNYYAKKLEKFYIEFYQAIVIANTKTLKGDEWSVIMPSIVYIVNAVFDRLEILKNTLKTSNVIDDIEDRSDFFPQYQNELFEKLLMDKETTASLLSVLYRLLNDTQDNNKFRNSSYFKALKLWGIRELVKLRDGRFEKSDKHNNNKSSIAVLHTYNLWPYLQKINLKNKSLVNIDNQIYSLYSLPRMPNKSLRLKLKLDILLILEKLNFERKFNDFKQCPKTNLVISTIIANLLPVSLIENFKTTKNKIEKIYQKVQPVVTLTCGAQFSDFGGVWLYIAKKNGLKVFTFQHGSGYTYVANPEARVFTETGIFPGTYFSWGKHFKENSYTKKLTKVVPLGSPYLNSLPFYNYQAKKIKKILFPLDNFYNYQSYLEGMAEPACVNKNIYLQINLLKKLASDFPDIELFVKDRGGVWDFMRQKLPKQCISNIKIITSNERTHNFFERDMLVFCTTTVGGVFHESLMSGMKFVLYKDQDQEFNTESAKVFFDKFIMLKLAGTDLDSLYECFKLQIRNQIDYQNKDIMKLFKDYSTEFCIKNKNFEKEWMSYLENL